MDNELLTQILAEMKTLNRRIIEVAEGSYLRDAPCVSCGGAVRVVIVKPGESFQEGYPFLRCCDCGKTNAEVDKK